MTYKLAIVHTHPIQYNSPFFAKLAADSFFDIKVFYTWPQAVKGFFDPKFKVKIKWDIPLLEGYEYELVRNISPYPSSIKFLGTINPSLVEKILRWKPDGVLVYGWRHWSHWQLMRRLKGFIPIYFRGDSTLLDAKNDFHTKFREKLLPQVYKFVDYALYVGSENKKYFLEYGLDEENLAFVPHAVENERFFDMTGEYGREAEQWRKRLNISREDLVFLYAGKFEPKKNLKLLVQAFRKTDRPDFRLILVGDGVEKPDLVKLAQPDKRIIFLPFQNQSKMPVVYRLGDVYVQASAYNETWGLSVNEAMASSRAVLVSNKVGCAVDLVFENKNGFIFKAKDEKDLIGKMQHFNKKLASSFGHKSREIIQEWTYERGIKNLKEFIISKKLHQ